MCDDGDCANPGAEGSYPNIVVCVLKDDKFRLDFKSSQSNGVQPTPVYLNYMFKKENFTCLPEPTTPIDVELWINMIIKSWGLIRDGIYQ